MNEQKILTAVLRKELAGITKALQDFFEGQKRQTTYHKGDPGHTPVKFKDYWTEEDIKILAPKVLELIYLPRKGIDYFTKEDRLRMIEDVLRSANLKDFYYSKKQVERMVRSLQGEIKKTNIVTIREVTKEKEAGDVSIDKAEKIARGLEKLKGKKRLDAKAIKNLPIPITYVYNTVAGSGVGTSVSVTDLSSQCNGVTKSFLMPAYSAILMVIITGWSPNGVLRPTVDFTTPDNTHIELTDQVGAPATGTTLIALYVPL